MSPARRRQAVESTVNHYGISERRACRVLGQCRATQRYEVRSLEDEDRLRNRIVSLSKQYGRYGYKRITALLNQEGWQVNHKRVHRLWREEGLKVPKKQPKRRRLWLNDGSCVRLRPGHKGHVWSYDFVHKRTYDKRSFRILTVIDEYSRESLATVIRRSFTTMDVIEVLANLFIMHEQPDYIRSDNGPEFTSKAIRKWLENLDVGPLFIEPGALGKMGTMSRSTASSGTNY